MNPVRQQTDPFRVQIFPVNRKTNVSSRRKSLKQRAQTEFKKQIEAALKDLTDHTYKNIQEYLQSCYENGFLGVLYDIRGQGVPLIFPINQEQVVKGQVSPHLR